MAVLGLPVTMATRWRRQRTCLLDAGERAPAALREVSGAGAYLATRLRPSMGGLVVVHHPEAGRVVGRVTGLDRDGVHVAFDRSEHAVAFAIAAIAADMTTPG